MTKRRMVTRIKVFYEGSSLKTSLAIPVLSRNRENDSDGLFWSDYAIQNILLPYYRFNRIAASDQFCKQLEECGKDKKYGEIITVDDVKLLWSYESENRPLPFMLAKKYNSSVKAYY